MKAGWTTKRLEELVEIRLGRTPPRAEKKFWDPTKATDNTWVSIADLSENEGGVITESKEHLSQPGADSTPLVKAGTLLVSFKLSLGKVAIAGKDLRTNEAIAAMPIKDRSLDVNWLKYFFQFFDWNKAAVGEEKVKGKALNKEKLKEIEIPLPPLAEQKRIVALLDEAFAGIDEAKAKTEANLEKATAVFESHLQSLFAIDNPDWACAKLSSLTTKIGSGATPRGGEESYKDEGVSLIRSLNVHDYGFKYAKLAFLDAVQAEELSGVTVQENDVLLNITGASVARCTIVPRGVLPARVNQHVAIIRPMPEKVSSAFLHYLLISQPYKSRLLETGEEGGSTRQAITKAQLLEFTISHPVSVETQQATAKHLDEVREQTQRLSQLHKQRLDALSALKQSILSQAFAGELTA